MAFLITTTGVQATVTFDDLGERKFTHTTTNFDLETEYPIDSLLRSDDLQNAITMNYITVTDGSGNPITDLSKYYMTKPVFDSNDDDVVDNSGQLDGFSASYYTDAANLTGTLPASVINASGLVDSVNGLTGSVTLETLNITENKNLYFTDTRSRQAIGVSASSGNYLNYDVNSGLFSLTALAITNVTVDTGVTSSADAYWSANYTGSEFQEGDTVVLTALTGGVETYMHNGGVSGTGTDFVRIQTPDLSDSYIRSLLSGDAPLSYSTSTGAFSITRADSNVSGYISNTDFATFNAKIDGSGIANYISKFNATGTITNSLIRDDGTSLGIGTVPSAMYQMSMLTTSLVNSVTITNTTNTTSTSTGMFVNNYGNLGDKIGIQVIGDTIDTDNVSVGGIFTAQGASYNTAPNKQYGVIVAVDGNQGFTHNSVGIEIQADDPHNGDTYGMIINSANVGSGSSYIGMFDDGRTTGIGKVLTAIDANGTVEWADIPSGGSVDSVNGFTGSVSLALEDMNNVNALATLQQGYIMTYDVTGGEWIGATGIDDSATASTSRYWSANKIYTELQSVDKQSWVWGAGSNRKNVTNTYLSQFGNANTNQSPYIAYNDCTITNMSVSTKGNATWIAEVRVNSVVAASMSVISIDSERGTFNVNVSAGDKVSFYCNGSSINKPNITILVKEQ